MSAHKGLALCFLAVVCAFAGYAQPRNARANVVAYDDSSAVEKNGYRKSSFFQELTGRWQQQTTDSSVIYSRALEAEKSWKYYQVFLNVRCGRAVRVLVNGKEMGYGTDSRHWNEFLLEGLKYGKTNDLAIEALKHPRSALLEDTSIAVGLNGEPFLLFKNDPNISDFSIQTDFNPSVSEGSFNLSASLFCGKKKGKYYVEVLIWDAKGREFDRMGRWVVFKGKEEEILELSRSWSGVEPWTAETPVLYTAVIRLRNERMEEEEIVGARFGFRRVEVKDGQLLVNGTPVIIKGVTYGIEHTEGLASRERMERDIVEMKNHNVNAVRTARYSPMEPWFYELCDRYGLYVVCDANLLPLSERHHAVATDRDFIPLFEQQVEHLYGKYKNHTSIIAWSLGNSLDNGVCMNAAYRRLKSLDKTRPVIFSGAGHSESTDIIALRYPDLRTLKQSLANSGNRPLLMLSVVDSARFPRLNDLWSQVTDHYQLQGGFIDLWPLSAAQWAELHQLFAPFDIRCSKITSDEAEFIVTNRNDFSNLSRYSLDYNIFTTHTPAVAGGDLPMALSPGESDKVTLRIPPFSLQPDEEVFVRFTLNRRLKLGEKNPNREAGSRQFRLFPQNPPQKDQPKDTVAVTSDQKPVTSENSTLNTEHSTLNTQHLTLTASLSRKPNTPYNAGTADLLFDGRKGTLGELTQVAEKSSGTAWLGFSGAPPVIVVTKTAAGDSDSLNAGVLTLRFAHATDSWVFAPQSVSVALSSDGIRYTDTVTVSIPFDPALEQENEPRVVTLQIPLQRQYFTRLKIIPHTLAAIPSWHHAKGLKPWLLIDEIEITER